MSKVHGMTGPGVDRSGYRIEKSRTGPKCKRVLCIEGSDFKWMMVWVTECLTKLLDIICKI